MRSTMVRVCVLWVVLSATGCERSSAQPDIDVALAAFGRAGAMHSVDRSATAERTGDETRIVRGPGIVEWWRPVADGLEQGVTFATRPSGRGPLVLQMAVAGATPVGDGDDIALLAAGQRVASYSGLVVLDADHREIASRMVAAGDRIRIEVDDDEARYPLVVDPLYRVLADGRIDPPADATSTDELGFSIAASSDGSRVIVGAPGAMASRGLVRIFVRSATGWTQEALLMTPSGADRFGEAVAMSADGSRAVVGAPTDTVGGVANCGSVRIFDRAGATWTAAPILTAPIGGASTAGNRFGASVDISDDGSRVVIGEPYFGFVTHGRVHVYARSGTSWIPDTPITVTVDGSDNEFGTGVAIDGTGTRLAGTSRNSRGVDFFDRSGTTWTSLGNFGGVLRVGMNSAGTVAVDGAGLGSIDMLLRTGGIWVPTLVTPSPAAPGFGASVALAGSDLIATGAPASGALYVFTHSGTTTTQIARLGEPGTPYTFGTATALSADGHHLFATLTGTAGPGAIDVFRIEAAFAAGESCASQADCLSDFCVDGVCCDTACGSGDESDCQACDGAGTVGTCAPLPAATACRAASDVCDAVEVCDGTATACPTDALAAPGTPCRAAIDVCDAAETCTGASALCPVDGFVGGIECRAAAGACDLAEVCAGSGPACPPDGRVSAGLACRVAKNPSCDPVEACDGTSTTCPADVTSCGTPDAGSADGGRGDGGSVVDVGVAEAPPVAAGCGCTTYQQGRSSSTALLVLLVLAVRSGRRRAQRQR